MEHTIVWDSFGLQSRFSGVGRHAFELNRALANRGFIPHILPSHPKLDPAFAKQLALAPSPWQADWMRFKPFSLWRASRQLNDLGEVRRGVIHGLSNFNLPTTNSRWPWRKVLTVHDMIPFLEPRVVSQNLSTFLRWQMPRALKRADFVICVSRWTEESLLTLFPEVRGRTRLVPNGLEASSSLTPISLSRAEKDSQGSNRRLLTISRDETYKRLTWVGQLLAMLPHSFSWDVVTDAGGAKRLGQDFGHLAERLRIHQQISDNELQALHDHSDVYVHPSLWEGYCLPAAQAIQSGVPVLYVQGSGIDETVGEAGQGMSRSSSIQQWVDTIIDMTQTTFDWKKACQSRCLTFATWDEVAARTLQVYDILE